MFDVLTVGEALVEIMRPDRDQPLDKPGEFLGPFASGAPAIFAVAAARLGLASAFIGGVGNDAFGRLLQARLTHENVNTAGLRIVPGRSTGLAFVGYTADGRREFVFHLRHSAGSAIDVDLLPAAYFSGIRWLHLSGSALALGDAGRSACHKTLDWTLAAGGRLSLDPNLRPELMPLDEARQALGPYLAVAALLLPTAKEARALTGAADDDAAASRLLGGQERIAVLKRGAQGCTVYTQQARLYMPGFTVAEVDPTGAGDCFNAAFLLGLNSGWDLERVARFANAAGALAVTKQGPMEGAPTVQEIEAFLAQAGRE
ncbi:MAG: sugar kinase [Chloroflexi bacterium]|nr:sugar kinase [Chloroflexota bacterium]MCI0578084.1 sugar kinase [Chloroflexota bacterium]MCI0646072.1 sugar kinase [Chloroflexota bacterium]MCI0730990.1 sugar kinase [Chloroflexota bacterium]